MPSESSRQVLSLRDFGVAPEGVPILKKNYSTEVRPGAKVTVQTAIWQQSEMTPNTSKHLHEGQVVIMSGLSTGPKEWPIAFDGLGTYFDKVVGIGHVDEPDAEVTPTNASINKESFEDSGRVLLGTIKQLTQEGILTEPVTGVGLSTGSVVWLEALKLDIEESSANLHPRYIKSLILMAPAGMMDRKSFKKLERKAALTLPQALVHDYLRDWQQRVFGDKSLIGDTPAPQPKMTWSQFTQNLKEAWNNPEWKDIRLGHNLMEIMEFTSERLPMDDLMAFFRRIWPNQYPHILPQIPTVENSRALIYKNVTLETCRAIKETPLTVVLFEKDLLVPPSGFLTEADEVTIKSTKLEQNDLDQLHRLNRIKPGGRYSQKWMLKNKQEGLKIDLIRQRVKDMFPHNKDNTKVFTCIGGSHASPKYNIDLIADTIFKDSKLRYGTQNYPDVPLGEIGHP